MKLILVLALSAFATTASAQSFPVHLRDGATWTITAEHALAVEGGGPAQNWNLTTVKRLTWHAPGADGAASVTVSPVSATPGPNSPVEVAQGRSLAIPATLTVGDGLAPRDILNREEVRAEFRRVAPRASELDAPLVDASAKAMIAAELGTASRGQGLAFTPGRPSVEMMDVANPLGGPPIRAMQTTQLESFDRTMGIAKVRWSQAVDQDSFRAVVASMVAQLGRQKLAPAKLAQARAALAEATYANRTDCSYTIDIRTGLASFAKCSTSTSLNVQGQSRDAVESWAITQTTPEPL